VEITGLCRDEAADFAVHHLGQEAAQRFEEEALSAIFEHGRGLPGLVLPYLERVLSEATDGHVTAETAEMVLDRWELT